MAESLDVLVKVPNYTKIPYDRYQLSFELKKMILGKYGNFICKSKQPQNKDIEAELHADYDKDFLYFSFRITRKLPTDLSLNEIGTNCKEDLEEKFKIKMLVFGTLLSDTGVKTDIII